MKTFIAIIILIITCSFYSTKAWTQRGIQANLELNVSSRWSTSSEEFKMLKQEYDTLESPRLMGSAEINYVYGSNAKWAFSGGLKYRALGYQIDSLNSLGITNVKYTHKYLFAPIGVVRYFGDSARIRPFVGLSIELGYRFGSTLEYKKTADAIDYRIKENSDLQRMALAASLKAGVSFKVSEQTSLHLQLSYFQMLTSISKGDIDRFLNSGALGLGFTRLF